MRSPTTHLSTYSSFSQFLVSDLLTTVDALQISSPERLDILYDLAPKADQLIIEYNIP